MLFSQDINTNLKNIKTLYDLAAYCYDYLVRTIQNQITFLGNYIEKNEDAQLNNPNFEVLNRFAMAIKEVLSSKPFYAFSSSARMKELMSLIVSIETDLENFEDAILNNATIPFFILMGVDLYIEDRNYEGYKAEPLNDYCKDCCLIYVNNNQSLMDKVMEENNYPEIINAKEIRFHFPHIIFFEKRYLPKGNGNPKMVILGKKQEYIDKIAKRGKINIALIPTMQDKWLDFPGTKGASFEVKYHLQKLEEVKDRVVKLLKKAIKSKANIIVFPEYVCNEEIQKEIGTTLSQMNVSNPSQLKELLFVVAGSSWTSDSNNVSCLYSYDGSLLGKVYKYSPFDNYINGRKYVEDLHDPGKEITLVKIPDIGIFQTEICRNVSENKFCNELSKAFNPQFLLIAAWSSSIKIGFKTQLESIISSNHRTCAALSNCCAAVGDSESFREDIGIIAVPQKNGSCVEGRFRYVQRKKQKCDNCCGEGCIFNVCYDFNGSKKQDVGVRIRFIKIS